MKNKTRGLSQKQRLFCVHYANSADIEKSALNAGYTKKPLQKGEQILSKPEAAAEIASIINTRENAIKQIARLGFERLAFSSVSDAVSLLFMENVSRETLSKMDLIMVSEIKKLKDGAMEIKFFDRIKALQNISDCEKDQDFGNSLIDAINLGAKTISELEVENGEL